MFKNRKTPQRNGASHSAPIEALESRRLLSATVTALPLHGVEGTSLNFTVATFTATEAKASASKFVASINWGDGTSSVGKIKKSGSGFVVTAKHAYAEESADFSVVSTTVTDKNDATTQTFTNSVIVTDAPVSVAAKGFKAKAGVAFTKVIAIGRDGDLFTGVGDIAVTINWGDGTSSAATTSLKAKKWSVVGSHTYAAKGTYTASVLFKDVFGGANATSAARISVS